jgi:hypothetical protein
MLPALMTGAFRDPVGNVFGIFRNEPRPVKAACRSIGRGAGSLGKRRAQQIVAVLVAERELSWYPGMVRPRKLKYLIPIGNLNIIGRGWWHRCDGEWTLTWP